MAKNTTNELYLKYAKEYTPEKYKELIEKSKEKYLSQLQRHDLKHSLIVTQTEKALIVTAAYVDDSFDVYTKFVCYEAINGRDTNDVLRDIQTKFGIEPKSTFLLVIDDVTEKPQKRYPSVKKQITPYSTINTIYSMVKNSVTENNRAGQKIDWSRTESGFGDFCSYIFKAAQLKNDFGLVAKLSDANKDEEIAGTVKHAIEKILDLQKVNALTKAIFLHPYAKEMLLKKTVLELLRNDFAAIPHEEMDAYLNIEVKKIENWTDWWKIRQSSFYHLSQEARKYTTLDQFRLSFIYRLYADGISKDHINLSIDAISYALLKYELRNINAPERIKYVPEEPVLRKEIKVIGTNHLPLNKVQQLSKTQEVHQPKVLSVSEQLDLQEKRKSNVLKESTKPTKSANALKNKTPQKLLKKTPPKTIPNITDSILKPSKIHAPSIKANTQVVQKTVLSNTLNQPNNTFETPKHPTLINTNPPQQMVNCMTPIITTNTAGQLPQNEITQQNTLTNDIHLVQKAPITPTVITPVAPQTVHVQPPVTPRNQMCFNNVCTPLNTHQQTLYSNTQFTTDNSDSSITTVDKFNQPAQGILSEILDLNETESEDHSFQFNEKEVKRIEAYKPEPFQYQDDVPPKYPDSFEDRPTIYRSSNRVKELGVYQNRLGRVNKYLTSHPNDLAYQLIKRNVVNKIKMLQNSHNICDLTYADDDVICID
ncbi:hypothetical protein EIN_391380 [Entamoeba invadens IP1]|uniref:Uncharacterized protein n=1 Tax=Entamoeba invadens IP1 TaxID=370355 RepID=A0A0A1U8R6_ENTIV|nr:hypothetical protein EIN_391380 [Entamoeba invadens IP1]ELP89483.1 hypothetical protein EIN_391380 [Entamoeba invadens IP1]|eukprot:XP_004256254.1 hypothetical protein EIN_391380 [Entamoeba invadens IP1]